MFPPFARLPRTLRLLNILFAVLAVGLVLAFLIVSFVVDTPPFDYALLMRGADIYCFQNEIFTFGTDWRTFYPAPFYTTFCLPYRYTEPLLRALWVLIPAFAALWLARGRAGAAVYPPLFILILLGQSSWLLLPAFYLAARDEVRLRRTPDDSHLPAPWWHGLALAPAVFKPHIAFLAVIYLLYRWWRQRSPAFYAGIAAMLLISLPAFIIRPLWPLEWLPSGRGFEPVNLASIAFVPVQALALGFAPGPVGQGIVYAFCLGVAAVLYGLLRWRRGRLTLYDAMLIFFFVNPFLNDYDLIVLLPFIVQSRRRLLIALVGGVLSWTFAMFTLRWSMSFFCLLTLLVLRLWVVRRENK